MVKNDAAFFAEQAKDGRIVEGAQGIESPKEGNSGNMQTNQVSQESERAKEHFEETDNLYRTALMESYNG
jgi:hypothetical protein